MNEIFPWQDVISGVHFLSFAWIPPCQQSGLASCLCKMPTPVSFFFIVGSTTGKKNPFLTQKSFLTVVGLTSAMIQYACWWNLCLRWGAKFECFHHFFWLRLIHDWCVAEPFQINRCSFFYSLFFILFQCESSAFHRACSVCGHLTVCMQTRQYHVMINWQKELWRYIVDNTIWHGFNQSLYLPSHSFSHNPTFMTIVEGWNIGWQANWKICLLALLPLHNNGPVQCWHYFWPCTSVNLKLKTLIILIIVILDTDNINNIFVKLQNPTPNMRFQNNSCFILQGQRRVITMGFELQWCRS